MTTTPPTGYHPVRSGRLGKKDCDLGQLTRLMFQETELRDYPYVSDVRDRALICDAARHGGSSLILPNGRRCRTRSCGRC